MRRYNELTEEEQAKAKVVCANRFLEAIIGGVRFNDEANDDDLQKRIDAAIAKAERLQTPWFAGEMIMETCGDEINDMASSNAEDAFYPDTDDLVIDIREG